MLHVALILASITVGQNPVRQADRADLNAKQGAWRVQSVGGFKSVKNKDEMKEVRLAIQGHCVKATWREHHAVADFVLRPTSKPAAIDITLIRGPKRLEGKTFLGRYVLEDGTLRIAYRNPGENRPSEMTRVGQ